MSDLIHPTEMYLRTIFELEEEGIVPIRARIAERLQMSNPTVSERVAGMEREGLLTVEGDRHLELTETGRELATKVMRKHRLAERLLTDVIGLDWELVHVEACRWEHVISDEVEKRLIEVLNHPTESPYGNPIPGLAALGATHEVPGFRDGTEPLSAVVKNGPVEVVLRRISEELQKEDEVLINLRGGGIEPGVALKAEPGGLGVRLIPASGPGVEVDVDTAQYLYVSKA
ncbi:metal-dependent transcriptional regulator [Naumannella halotolerans]|uniref:DtxR family Mn-dependent transcriptional regulator n=1 Tax=Naumannella halotolerans TaxID=993414 RepID=A0A4V3EN48_9ACTN|nr:metal-dependent transcriptional regulator [Naumannella halotolerans]TDT32458.1 DtxR family Mn-dependent transcriptional regulator [Naumannella halotolerans]